MKTVVALSRAPAAPAEVPRRLLLVDDDSGLSSALARLLRGYGYDVEVAATAAKAAAALRRSRPDIVLTDLMLPDADGHEVARQARQLEPRPHCLMLTGWADAVDQDDGGFDRVFAKPIEFSTLLDYLSSLPRYPLKAG